MNNNEFQHLIAKYQRGECNEAEVALVEYWYWQYNKNEQPQLTTEEIEAAQLEISQRLPKPVIVSKLGRPFPTLRFVACAAVLLIGVSLLLIIGKTAEGKSADDVQPGQTKAVLLLSNGKSYELDDTKEGEVAEDQGVKIILSKGGLLEFIPGPDIYATSPKIDSISGLVTKVARIKPEARLNSVTTPTGGQFHFALPDGTVIWLNAASTLRFPSNFASLPERRVYLQGEAYFEVTNMKTVLGMKKRAQRIPFIVHTNDQEVKVMGTEFNINSYDYDKSVKTTLVSGLLQVSSPTDSLIIKPGMRTYTTGNKLNADKADVALDIAWKNGDFAFASENLGRVMIKIARWYNVEVIYTDRNIKNKPFSGNISKYKTISEVLKLIQITGEIKYKIEGKKVTISHQKTSKT